MTSGRRDLWRGPDPVSFMQRSLKRVFKSLLVWAELMQFMQSTKKRRTHLCVWNGRRNVRPDLIEEGRRFEKYACGRMARL